MSPAVAVSAILVLRPVNKRYEWCLGIVFGTSESPVWMSSGSYQRSLPDHEKYSVASYQGMYFHCLNSDFFGLVNKVKSTPTSSISLHQTSGEVN